MKKILTLINEDKHEETKIAYKTTSKVGTGLFSLLIDVFAFIFFDWWWFIVTIIFTTIFSIKRYQKIDSVVSNVRMLISAGYQPKNEIDAKILVVDFKIHPKLITSFSMDELENNLSLQSN